MKITKELDTFVESYLTTALSTSLDKEYSYNDFASETCLKVIEDCCNFLMLASPHIKKKMSPAALGRDFWLTRNNGCGFNNHVGLTKVAKSFNKCELYVGDDGKLRY